MTSQPCNGLVAQVDLGLDVLAHCGFNLVRGTSTEEVTTVPCQL
ncbi:hypothetical protein ACTXO9_01365 [Brachybacterium tyrofermentans]